MKTKLYYSCSCILIAALTILLWGCSTDNMPYRNSIPVPPGTPQADLDRPADMPPIDSVTNACIERHDNFNIGYVELDDQGWFWAHNQWAAVKNEIEQEHSNAIHGLTIVVFVHGWKNNAAYDNGNVEMFRGVLANLSSNISPRKIFGVYVGWRGWSIKNDYFPVPAGQELSFYHRKDVAERIGHQGPATQIFTELEGAQDDFNEFNRSNNVPPTELIIIGHSFGGQLVYSAISQILTERLVMANHNKGLKSFGNLVILVNPAFEASLYNNLISLATSDDIHYPPDQKPVLAIFESKGDSANGFWFPVGRFFSTWYEKIRPGGTNKNEIWMFNVRKNGTANEKVAIQKTVGFDQQFINYDLNYTNYGTNRPPSLSGPGREGVVDAVLSQQEVLRANNTVKDPVELKPYTFVNSTNSPNGTNYYACTLQPRTNGYSFKSRNPFLNVAVDKTIINNHTDINNPIFLAFLRNFILFTETNFPSENKSH